jgi:quercetin dioxygenase-like cupin family protein
MKDFINQVINLNSFVDYAKKSIVSKIIYKNRHAILTLFALDKGQSIAEHITPFDAMVQIIEGEAELTIGGKKKLFKAGSSIIMPANIPHALKAKTAYKMLLTMLK